MSAPAVGAVASVNSWCKESNVGVVRIGIAFRVPDAMVRVTCSIRIVSASGNIRNVNLIEIYIFNISGGEYNTDAGRYPNHGIWNPEGNTDPDNAYLTYFAPTIDGTNGADSWGGHAFGRARIGALTTDTTKNLTHSTPPYYQYLPDAYDVSKDGIIIAVDANQDWTTGTVAYQGTLIIYRGEWDEGIDDFVFERSLYDFPTNAENDRPTHVKFAFGPDGQTGWIVVITDNSSGYTAYRFKVLLPGTYQNNRRRSELE